MISLIVASSLNNVIGKNNALPWHLPKDLQYFKKVTTGKTIIMGRNTYDSIGKALPNRKNIVLSKKEDYKLDDALTFKTLEEALKFCKTEPNNAEIMIIGGAKLFNYAFDYADLIYLNIVQANVDGDVYLDFVDKLDNWKSKNVEVLEKDDKNIYSVNCYIYERK